MKADVSSVLRSLGSEEYLGAFGPGWPTALKEQLSETDVLGTTPKPTAELLFRALGAVIEYLKRCLIDVDLVGLRKFEAYNPTRSLTGADVAGKAWWTGRRMVLDGIGLENLKVLGNGEPGTLLAAVDRTSTPLGRRLLREWLCAPLLDPAHIAARQDSVAALMGAEPGLKAKLKAALKVTPDLQRALLRVHSLGSKFRAESHPEARAIFFDADKAAKRKVADLLTVIKGFQTAQEMHELLTNHPDVLKGELGEWMGSGFPDIRPELARIEAAFDQEKARKDGVIIPEAGSDPDFDEAVASIRDLEVELDHELGDVRKRFRAPSIKYFGSGRNRFQLEIPEASAKNMPHDFLLTSQRKGFKRYENPATRRLLEEMTAAETKKAEVLGDILRRMFALFAPRDAGWARAVAAVARLDVLLGLADLAANSAQHYVRPLLREPNGTKGFVRIEKGFHPGLMGSGNYIPNSVSLGGDEAPIMLLTGPNMGGKSTLMRQVSLLVIMAQIGSFVPATHMELSPVDRIFTRLGARDKIAAGQSTFMVEMAETLAVLLEGSGSSLVVVDELGRGTGTRDGTAIAAAVLDALAELRPRCLFSTHFHALSDAFKGHKDIVQRHMACMVEGGGADGDVTEESVTFLYTLAPGPCPSSYGFHAAQLAGLPKVLVKRAAALSRQLAAQDNDSLDVLRRCRDELSDEELINRLKYLLN